MKKHSPNFHQNLHEAETAQYHWGRTTALIFALAAVLMFAFTSCTKGVEEPIELKPPTGRPKIAVELSIRFYPSTHPLVKGNVYGVEIKASQILKTHTEISISWKDSIFNYTLIPHIRSGENQIRWETMLPIHKGASDVRLNRVSGDTTLSYQLKVIP